MKHASGEQLGEYVVDALIGEGGMACVYRVHHHVLQSPHALKVLHPHLAEHEDIRRRFLEEGKILGRFRHPNLIAVTDLVNEEGVAGLVMDLLQGEDLAARLERTGPVSVSQAISWTLQALHALSMVHAESVIHRDLKPSNLFLSSDFRDNDSIRVMDFGIAKVKTKPITEPTQGRIGTLSYMSPEQVQHPGSVDQRSDIFSMGAILYEMMIGRSPFEAENDFQIMQRIAGGHYTRLDSSVPAALVTVVDTALSVDPSQRFPSAEAFSAALRTVERRLRRERLNRVLEVASSENLPQNWWVPDDPPEAWLSGLEEMLQSVRLPPRKEKPGQTDILIANKLSISMVAIEAGDFMMGSHPVEANRHPDEGPQHPVTLPAFSLMTTPVTQRQWVSVMDYNPAHFSGDLDRPVEQVSWMDAIRFLNQLSRKLGKKPAYYLNAKDEVVWNPVSDGFRLPTEAEWEYACRAGTTAPYGGFGEKITSVAWYDRNSNESTQPVSRLAPNAWGLFDMRGNVYEWCFDWSGAYAMGAVTNPIGPASSKEGQRVMRGGSFRSTTRDLRAAFRNAGKMTLEHCGVGFRCACNGILSPNQT